jgi:hypothetical protein
VAAKVGIKSYTELHKGVTELHRKKALCETPRFPVFPDIRKEKTFTHQTKEYCSSWSENTKQALAWAAGTIIRTRIFLIF